MDTNKDWATKEETEKDDKYSTHLGFINHLSKRGKSHNGSTRLPSHQPIPG